MANLFFGVKGPTLDLKQDLQISDTDAPRIMNYLLSSEFGKVTENVITTNPDISWTPKEDETEEDRPSISTQSWVTRQATPEEAASNYAKYVLNQLLESTLQFERNEAVRIATEAIAPIERID